MTLRRDAEVQAIARTLAEWARDIWAISGLAIVGSWASDAAAASSDLDVVLLTDDPDRFTTSDEWLEVLGRPPIIGGRQFGAVTERRVVLPSGLEIEFGVGSPSWAEIDPVDPGTARVVSDGFWILHDPEGLLVALQTAVECAR